MGKKLDKMLARLHDEWNETVWWWRDHSKDGEWSERILFRLYERACYRIELPEQKGWEWHHTIPKCVGGENFLEVPLLGEEHFLAHYLLIRIAKPGDIRRRMLHGLGRMTDGRKGITPRQYAVAMRAKAEALGLQWNDEKFRAAHKAATVASHSGENNPAKRPEVRAKISEAMVGNTNTPTGDANPMRDPEIAARQAAQMTGDQNPMRRPELSGDNHANKREEVRDKISASHLARADDHWTKTGAGRATRSRKQSSLWDNPEYRAQQSAARKIGQAKRREREAAMGGVRRPDMVGDNNPRRRPDADKSVSAEARAAMSAAQQARRAREAEIE